MGARNLDVQVGYVVIRAPFKVKLRQYTGRDHCRMFALLNFVLTCCTAVLVLRTACRYILELLKSDLKPRDIMTYKAFENAMVTVMATGETQLHDCARRFLQINRSVQSSVSRP